MGAQQKELFNLKKSIIDSHNSESQLLSLLLRLQGLRVDVAGLKATGIGKQVNALRHHSSERVRDASRLLVRRWTYVVDEWLQQERLKEEEVGFGTGGSAECPNKGSTCTTSKQPKISCPTTTHQNHHHTMVQAHESSQQQQQPSPHLPDAEAYTARIERAKRNLHKAYEAYEKTKGLRTVKVIDPKYLPPFKKAAPRRCSPHRSFPKKLKRNVAPLSVRGMQRLR